MIGPRLLILAGVMVWAGSALILSALPRLNRKSLVDRLGPFHPGGRLLPSRPPPLSASSLRDIAVPLAEWAGAGMARAFGVSEAASTRLRRIHSSQPAALFRLRQMTLALAVLIAGAAVAGGASLPGPAALLVAVGPPVLAFLVVEQRLVRRSEKWQQDLARELPVIAEQLAMLIGAGYSLGAALDRLASRGKGCCAQDLARVTNRTQQGVSLPQALREWADLARVEAVDRLVAVLSLHGEAPDLSRLVTEEARQCRRELHRRTIEALERRSEQVWVPVTVATLVPGAILLAVPFLAALKLFAGTP